MRTLPLLTMSALATLAVAAPAAAATISPAHVRFPQVAVNAKGRTVVAWERLSHGRFTVEARIGEAPTRLGSVRGLARIGYRPLVAVGADGTAAVEWTVPGPGRATRVRVAIARPGRGFGRARTVEQRKGNVWPTAIAIQPGGRVVAVWQRSSSRLAYALGLPGHRFGGGRALATTGSITRNSIAVDPRDGTVLVAYGTALRAAPPTNTQAAVRALTPAAQAFSDPVVLSALGIAGEALPIAVAGPGGAGVGYTVSAGVPGLRFARRAADGSWAPPQTIAVSGAGTFSAGLGVTLPADGAAVAAWTADTDPYEPMGLPLGRQPFMAVAPAGAAFGTRQPLAPAGRRFSDPSVAAAGGEAFVATAEQHGQVLLATRSAGAATFGALLTLTRKGDGDVQLAAAGSQVLAAYQQGDRLRLRIVR